MIDLTYWTVELFSPMIWQLTSDLMRSFYGITIFILCSGGYLGICKTLAKRNDKQKEKFLGIISLVYFLVGFTSSSLMFDISIGPQVSFLALFFSLLYLQLVILIMLGGVWMAKFKESVFPSKLIDFLRTQYWLSSLNFSILIFPLVIFGINMVSTQSKTIYLGNIFLATSGVYLALKIIISASFTIFKLEIFENDLPEELRRKYQTAAKPLAEYGDQSIRIVRKGFRNALAVKSTNSIFIGIDLIDFLSVEEVKAVLLHEMGHLRDEKYVPRLRRLLYLVAVLYFFFQISSQLGVLSPFVNLAIFFVGLFVFLQVVRKVRLRSEYVADSFVKDFSKDLHKHLITGLQKLQKINLVHKDLCKNKNIAHLDLDEREKMVSEGAFEVKRKSGLRSTLVFIATLAFVVCLQLIYQQLPSSVTVWRQLHNNYHKLYSDNEYTKALGVISKAYDYSKAYFGDVHYRTYLSTNDLANVSLALDDILNAEKYAIDAVDLGYRLFKENNARHIRSMRSLISVYYKQNRVHDIADMYSQILRVQKKTGASPSELGSSLFALIRYHTRLEDSEKIIESMNELLSVYKSQTEQEDDPLLLFDLFDFLYDESDVISKEFISDYLSELEQITLSQFGEQSLEYATFWAELANYQEHGRDFFNAKKAYDRCLDQFKSIGITDDEDYRNCLYKRGIFAQEDKEYTLAQSLFFESIHVGKLISGENTSDIKYEAMRIADIYAEQSKNEDAIRYYKLAINLEESDPKKNEDHLLHGYKSLLSVLNQKMDKIEVSELETKISEIEKHFQEKS